MNMLTVILDIVAIAMNVAVLVLLLRGWKK